MAQKFSTASSDSATLIAGSIGDVITRSTLKVPASRIEARSPLRRVARLAAAELDSCRRVAHGTPSSGLVRLRRMAVGWSVRSPPWCALFPKSDHGMSDLLGDSLDLPGLLGRGTITSAEVVPGTERRWPQSHSAVLHVRWADGEDACIFLKRTPAAVCGSEGARPNWRRDALSCRAEARFYSEFAPTLRERGVRLPRCLAVSVDPLLDAMLPSAARHTPVAGDVAATCGASAAPAKAGTVLVLERFHACTQHSPLSRPQALRSLQSLARLHAAAWEDVGLLRRAAERLHPTGGTWWALPKRDASELNRMAERWPAFLSAFASAAPNLVSRPSVQGLPARLSRVAQWVAAEVRVGPDDAYATLVHGDYKAANLFFPRDGHDTAGGHGQPGSGRKPELEVGAVGGCTADGDASASAEDGEAVPVDFQWTGVGLGMSDVAYHLTHAVGLDALQQDSGERGLILFYLAELRARLPVTACLTDEVAVRQYTLALLDYARLLLSRFVTSPAECEAVGRSERKANVGVAYRDSRAAVALVERVEAALSDMEARFGWNDAPCAGGRAAASNIQAHEM